MPALASTPPEMSILRDLLVPMRDGVRLATDVYLPVPSPHEALPAIIERTPYGKATNSRAEIDHGAEKSMSREEIAAYFVANGYVVIYQDCRGRGGSEGSFTKYLAEGEDGVDTLEWIRRQPWSDGRIGMMGLSYAAHTQFAPACLGPEGLDAIILDCGGFSSGYHSGMRQGGALELRQATWAYTQALESREAATDPVIKAGLKAENIADWFRQFPWKPGHSPLRWVPEYEAYLFEQWTNGAFGPYWRKNGIYARDDYETLSGIAQVHLSGWYDTYVASTIENYLGVAAYDKAEAMLVIGPWLHGDRSQTSAGDVDFGTEAALDGNLAEHWRAFRLAWFDRHLKPLAKVGDAAPPVRVFVMGGGSGRSREDGRLDHGGHWIGLDAWPPSDARETALYLDAAALRNDPPAGESERSYLFDPDHPVPTIGGAFSSGAPLFYPGAFDQREHEDIFGATRPGMPLAARRDVLVFETDPLEDDVAIVGPVFVDLTVSSDCTDTDFTAKLIDQYPPSEDYPRGYALNLTDGILRCRYRTGWEQPELMEPGRRYTIRIELLPTANLFRRGHRIRLDISSSNFPKFDVNPNSGEPEGQGTLPRVATNTVHLGGATPSRLVLQVLDPDTLENAALKKEPTT